MPVTLELVGIVWLHLFRRQIVGEGVEQCADKDANKNENDLNHAADYRPIRNS